jgi:fumarate reductase flavoprotein subunit
MSDFEFSVPVLVAGGGACGAVAGLAAAEAGADVLVFEQDGVPRGSTAMSQGLICAAATRAQAAMGVNDNADIFFDDIMAKTRGQTDPVLARTIADGAGPCVDWLVDRYDLPYTLDIRFKAAYGNSRARVHGWLGRGGEDLIQFLHGRLAAEGIDVLLKARLIDILADDEGRVLGVVLERPGGEIERIGCGALVLATSGFAANRAMVGRYMPELKNADHHCHEGNLGLGIELGARLGGVLADMGSYQGYAMLADPQRISLPPGHIIEGGVLLNLQGRRFVDEAEDIAGMLHPVMAQPQGVVWAIYDEAIEARCAYIPETQQLVALKAARSADTLEALAAAIGAPVDTISASLSEAHAAKVERRLDRVGRSWSEISPPKPPYRALRVKGALYHTQGGLQIDAAARVVRPDGSALPNLFAGGGAARGVSGPSSWGYLPAMGLCEAVTLGRIAGQSAATLTQKVQTTGLRS